MGKGTTFNLYLPITDAAGVATHPPQEAVDEKLLAGKVVLVVEDDARVRRMSIKRIEALGGTVVDAQDGSEALATARTLPQLDLLFTDIVMPGGVNGYQLAQLLKVEQPDLRVLLTSGYAEATANAQELEQSGFRLLRKPYRQLDLSRMIQRVMED